MKVYCKYLKNDGFCAKGRYCEFSHNKSLAQTLCRAYSSTGSCRYGKSCTFLHQSQISRPSIEKTANVKKADSLNEKEGRETNETTTREENIESVDDKNRSLWGFDTSNDNVYFYGAPGTFSYEPEKTSSQSYARVAKSNLDEEEEVVVEAIGDSTAKASQIEKRKPICSFFLSGTCKFGSFCRNSHDTEDELPFENNANEVTKECGICLSLPEDGIYGMLNNCNCTYCLKCIRGWRKDGVEVARDSQVVRKCPLCRIESYFICPSTKPLTGSSKQRALDAYREALKRIPCKVRHILIQHQSQASMISCCMRSITNRAHVHSDHLVSIST